MGLASTTPRTWLVTALAMVVLLAAPLVWALERLPLQPLTAGELEVPTGMAAQRLGAQLRAQHGMQLPVWLFGWYTRVIHVAPRLRAGEYAVSEGETLAHLLARIVRGDVIQRRVTLVEGWTFARVRAELLRAPRLRAKLPNLSEAQIRERLGIRNPRLEGLFLPDTYAYVAGMSDLDVLALAYTRLLDVLHEEWEERVNGLPYASPYEALIVASLVEKETGRAQDRAAIAEVFAERLRLGMKLQTDPSVIYAMGPNFNGNLTRADLATDDPYNTYMYAGLPPSPIALAGRAALHATLHPLATGDLYFVARGDGSSEFSQTLAQHDRAVDRFQRGRTGSQNNSPLVPALPEAALPAASAPGASPSPPMRAVPASAIPR